MKTIAICDDDEIQLDVSRKTVEAYVQSSDLDARIAVYSDVAACIDDAREFDVVFMDIEFDEKPSGIDAVTRINELAPNCQVVYLTNYLHYSLDVYQTDHVWYVLKSQLEERLPEIFRKVALIEAARRASIVITDKDDGALVNVPCESILYLERRERITHIVTQTVVYHVREKLSELLARLPEDTFARCHNSYVVNLPHVREVNAADLRLEIGLSLQFLAG